MKKNVLCTLLIALALLLSACEKTTATQPVAGSGTGPTDTARPPVVEASPTPTPSPVPPVPLNLLPPEPQNVTFQTPQGRTLQGRYFPAAAENAPVVVLIHWIMANQDDWQVVAAWLQNRGQTATGACSMPFPCPWWDSSWFPPIGQRTYAVFTFTLSGCEPNDGCATISRQAWAEDANAAILYASQLQGVDPARIVTAGASIGADAAIDSCAWLNAQGGPGHCLGSLAFSPGSYLVIDYPWEVMTLDTAQPPVPAWCLFADGDGEAAPTCKAASGTTYRMFEYAGNAHGMLLIVPDLAPRDSTKTTLDIFLEFLDLTLAP